MSETNNQNDIKQRTGQTRSIQSNLHGLLFLILAPVLYVLLGLILGTGSLADAIGNPTPISIALALGCLVASVAAFAGKLRIGTASEGFLTPEAQKQRWIKYGANVAVSCLLVIALAGGMTWLAQKSGKHLDTTAQHVYSLKPQTLSILEDLNKKITLINLYAQKPEKNDDMVEGAKKQVDDLLAEYGRASSNIEVESIDPVENPAKADELVNSLMSLYAGEIHKYKLFLTKFLGKDPSKNSAVDEVDPASTLGQIVNIADTELNNFRKAMKLGEDEALPMPKLLYDTLQQWPQGLKKMQESIRKQMKAKPPAYKDSADAIQAVAGQMSLDLDTIISQFLQYQNDTKVPAEFRQYIKMSLPNFKKMKELVDGVSNDAKNLGEMKLDDLRRSLQSRDTILIKSDTDVRFLDKNDVWQATPNDVRRYVGGVDAKLQRKFAGEQQISTAILALNTKKKPKVVFVRAGGPPLTMPSGPYQEEMPPFMLIAARLRMYNFDVLEKDLSGQWAMQAQMRQMPAPPEPSDAEIKDAVWVVIDHPTQNPMGMPPESIEKQVKAHLDGGGSALVMTEPQSESLGGALNPWGINVRTDMMIIHEPIQQGDAQQADYIEDAKRVQFVFEMRDYGDALPAKPLRSLSSLHALLQPVTITEVKDHTTAGMLPIPSSYKSWGKVIDMSQLNPNTVLTLDKQKDMSSPQWAGATSESAKGNRLVVIASPMFATNAILQMEDPDMAKRRVRVTRFPGNMELFTNSIFWLAKMDSMVAISPAAMDVERIAPMGPRMQNFWRNTVLLIVLPLAVVMAGLWMYFRRMD